jgi:intein/homing endonuclease
MALVNISKMGRGKGICYKPPKTILDVEVAELLGLHAGDGYISCGVWGILCNIRDEKMAQRIVVLVRNVLGVEPCVSTRQNTFEIRSGQRQAVRFFNNYGFVEGKKAYDVRAPSQIMHTDNGEIVKAFLRGLFSSDGSFSFRKSDLSCRVDLTIRSKLLRDEFVELSSRIGFSFNLCDAMRVKKGFTERSAGAFFNSNLTSKKCVLKWMNDVGTLCDSHLKKLKIWQATGKYAH